MGPHIPFYVKYVDINITLYLCGRRTSQILGYAWTIMTHWSSHHIISTHWIK